MKKNILTLLLLLAAALHSSAQGIQFESGLSWPEIKAKAKAENKLIFVDCYATWCGPCKQMDKEVYPTKKAGDYFNPKFISVKVQMDRTPGDSKEVKDWYAMADSLKKKCQIEGYPTFLFFTSEGKLLHKGMGYRSTGGLIMMASDMLGTMVPEDATAKENEIKETKKAAQVPTGAAAITQQLTDAFGEKGKLDYGSDTSWAAKAGAIDDKFRQNPPKPGDGVEDDPWKLNMAAWDAFENCNEDAVLNRALVWSEVSIALDSINYKEKIAKGEPVGINYQLLDTKANLLHKLGRTEEAIKTEELAIKILEETSSPGSPNMLLDEYKKILAKMKAGRATWPE